MSTAVGYCRISHDPSGRELGVDRQTRDVKALAAREGIELADVVIDNDRSASRAARKRREGWDALLVDVKTGKVTTIVAYDIDRVTRQPRELETLIDAAEDHGLVIRVVTGEFPDISTAMGQATARVLMALAAAEAKKTSDRQKTKLRHDAENGRPHWARRPYGYTMDAVPVPSEVTVVRRMARRVLEGASTSLVARELHADGLVTAAGKPWQQASVVFTLTNPRSAGLRAHHGEVLSDEPSWEPLLDIETWKAVGAAIDARRRGPKQAARISLLSGLVVCGRCGVKMYRQSGGAKASYTCTKRQNGNEGCGSSIRSVPVDHLIVDAVLEEAGTVRPAAPVPSDALDEVAALQDEIDTLVEMQLERELPMAEYRKLRKAIDKRMKAAQGRAGASATGAAFDKLIGDPATLAERWDDLEVDVRHALVSEVIDKITVAPVESRGRSVDLGRVSITWRQ